MYTVNHGAISCFGRLNQFCFKVLNSAENSRLKDTDDIVYEITNSLNNVNNSFEYKTHSLTSVSSRSEQYPRLS